MAITSIVRIDHDGKPMCLYNYDAQSKHCKTTPVDQWSNQSLSGVDLYLLVPASWVYHTQTEVASKNIELLSKSLPFAIEEELGNDVEDNYYGFKLNEGGSQQVIAIEKVYLDLLKEQIETCDLNVVAIHSEVDWIPVSDSEISVWSDDQTSLLKLDQNQAMRVANSQMGQLLPIYSQDKECIVCNVPEVINHVDLPIKNNLSVAGNCEFLLNQKAINLYLDEIHTDPIESSSNSWKGVKTLFGLLAASWLVIQGIQWYVLNQSITEIKQQQKNLLLQNYPNAAPSELVDPFAALQSRMKITNSQTTKNSSMLITVVDKLGQAIQQEKSVNLNGLRLVDQKMELQIVAPNMTVINNFHESLQKHANDYSVQIGVNELSDDNTFKSILTMVPR